MYKQNENSAKNQFDVIREVVALTQKFVGSENLSVDNKLSEVTILGEVFGKLSPTSIVDICNDINFLLASGIYERRDKNGEIGQETILRGILRKLQTMRAVGSHSYYFGKEIESFISLNYEEDYVTLEELEKLIKEAGINNSIWYHITETKNAIKDYISKRDND